MDDNETRGPSPAGDGGGDKGREGGNRRRRFRGRRRRPPADGEARQPDGGREASSGAEGAERAPGEQQADGGRRGGRRDGGRREGGPRDERSRQGGDRGDGARAESPRREGQGGERRGRKGGQRGERGPRDGNRRPGDRDGNRDGNREGSRGGNREGNRGGNRAGGRSGRPQRGPGGPGRGGDRQPARGDAPPQPPVLRVLLAGGGTGGHIYPALAVADEVARRNRESRVLFVGTRTGLESKLVPEAGYSMTDIEVSGFAGKGPLARVMAVFQLVSATLKMKGIIREFAPEIVVGTGGYVSGPAVLAARWAGIPAIIQEQNSIPGQMNRLLARFVNEIHVAFTETRLHFRQTEKIRLSGNPTRIRQPKGSLLELHRRWGLDPARKTVLVVGGSRGARSLNQAMADMLPLFAGRRDVQFIVQTGEADQARVREALSGLDVQAVVRPYLAPIEEAYGLATLIVCRAGAMTLAEIAQFGLPAVLVPYPHAIYQHQLMNARILAEKDAAELLLDENLTGPVLAERINALLGDQARRRVLGANVWKLARPDAPARLVSSLEQLTHPVAAKRPVDWVSGDAETAAAMTEA